MIQTIISYLIDFVERNYQQKKILKYFIQYNIKSIVDGGAHKGEFVSFIKNSIKDYEKIYSFEPQIAIFNILNSHSDLKRIFCYNYALSNVNGIKKLKINNITSTSTFSEINENSNWFIIKNLLLSGKNKSSFIDEESVNTITLDDFIKDNKILNIDLLKLDTEGHDLYVLKGSINILKQRKVKFILIEFHLSQMYKNYNYNKIHEFLLSFNFILVKRFKFPFLMHEDRVYKLIDQ